MYECEPICYVFSEEIIISEAPQEIIKQHLYDNHHGTVVSVFIHYSNHHICDLSYSWAQSTFRRP